MNVFETIVADPLATVAQKESAQKILDAAKTKISDATIDAVDGRVTLPKTASHVRVDGSEYAYGPVVVSESYAKELKKRFGNLTDGRATSWASAFRLYGVLEVQYGTKTADQLRNQFPDFDEFVEQCKERERQRRDF